MAVSGGWNTGTASGGSSGAVSVGASGASSGAVVSGSVVGGSGTITSGSAGSASGAGMSGGTGSSSGTFGVMSVSDAGPMLDSSTSITVAEAGSCANGACSAATTSGPSCAPGGPGMTDCGANKESCCTSLEVPGGTFSTFSGAVPASVSTFRLDKYDVTVGRFRQFVSAWYGAGWTPAAGSGKHVHLNGGQGLVNLDVAASAGTVYEPGWIASDDVSTAPLDTDLVGAATSSDDTWTAVVGNNENLPLNGVSWYEAFAFCIWDGGFLPSQVEWEYAASGGDEQRTYPWGETDPGTANEYAIYADPMNDCYYPTLGPCDFNNVTNIAPVGTASAGAARWGQLDLSGNVMQWSLDSGPPHVLTAPPIVCVDCAYFEGDSANLGGYFYGPEWQLVSSGLFVGGSPTNREDAVGFRCARTP